MQHELNSTPLLFIKFSNDNLAQSCLKACIKLMILGGIT